MKPNVVVVVLVVAVVVLASILLHVLNEKQESDPSAPLSPGSAATIGPTHTEYLKSSLKVRPSSEYNGPILYNKLTPSSLAAVLAKNQPKNTTSPTTSWDSMHCEKWAVVTTINEPTTAVQKLAHLSAVETKLVNGGHAGWCLLVVADTGSPESYTLDVPNHKFTYLSVSRQKELAATASTAQKELYQALPWSHVGRKNAGYLYALRHGGRYIYDFDDDVLILNKHHTIYVPGEVVNPATKVAALTDYFTTRVPSAPYDAEVFNPFPLFEANHNPSWPRGFPPERILSNSSTHEAPIETATVKLPRESIGVMQYLANHDPDVDSMYRLIRPLPLDFPLHGVAPLVLPGQRSAEAGSNRVGGSADKGGGAGGAERGGIARESRVLSTEADTTSTPPTSTNSVSAVAVGNNATTATATASAGAAASTTTNNNKPPSPLTSVPPYTHTVYAPYNSQSTLHAHKALFALLLPLTAHRQVSDIWRSYIAQRLFAEIGVRVAFHSPNCAHIRKSKDTDLPDMLSQLPLYSDSLSFVHIMRAFKGVTATLPGRMEELYVHLYEQGFIGVEDVNLVQKWIAALLESGYDFPALVK